MKCKCCGKEIIRIKSCRCTYVCDAQAVTYWASNPNETIITPNGEEIYGRLDGKIENATGIGYLRHTCN